MATYNEIIDLYTSLKQLTTDEKNFATLNYLTCLRTGQFQETLERAKAAKAVFNEYQQLDVLIEMAIRQHIPTSEVVPKTKY